MAMVTSIQISEQLKDALKQRKMYDKETYEEIIWDLLEDQMELKSEVLESIEQGLKEYEEGKFFTSDEVFKALREE